MSEEHNRRQDDEILEGEVLNDPHQRMTIREVETEATTPKSKKRKAPPPDDRQRRDGINYSFVVFVFLTSLSVMCACPIVMAAMGVTVAGDFIAGLVSGASEFFPEPEITVSTQELFLGYRDQAWLETNRGYYQERVRRHEDRFMQPDREITYEGRVIVTSGVDLQLLTQEDFVVDGTTITVTVPAPQLKDCFFDQEFSRVVDRNWYCDLNACEDMREFAEDEALERAVTNNYEANLVEAQQNAEQRLQDLAQQFGYDAVIIMWSDETLPLVATDGTCETHQLEADALELPTGNYITERP